MASNVVLDKANYGKGVTQIVSDNSSSLPTKETFAAIATRTGKGSFVSIVGRSDSDEGIGVWGQGTRNGSIGVKGDTFGGIGVYGEAKMGIGKEIGEMIGVLGVAGSENATPIVARAIRTVENKPTSKKPSIFQLANLQEWQDGTGKTATFVDRRGNIGLGVTATNLYVQDMYQFANGVGVLGIANATVSPIPDLFTGCPSNGGVLYAENGAGKWLSPSGTATTFGNAEPHCPECGRDFMLEWKNPKYGHLQVCMWCFTETIKAGVVRRELGKTKQGARKKKRTRKLLGRKQPR